MVVTLKKCHVTKFLGVNIDSKLRFNSHINEICNKLSRSVGIIYKLKNKVPCESLISLYYTFVYPYVLYCNLVWGGTFECHLQPLIIIQKKIIRIITNSGYLAHTNPLFYQTGILKVIDVHKFLLAQYAYKSIVGNDVAIQSHGHYTRYRDDIVPAFQRLSLTQHSVSYTAPKIFNDLPNHIKNVTCFSKFKVLVKNCYVERYRV